MSASTERGCACIAVRLRRAPRPNTNSATRPPTLPLSSLYPPFHDIFLWRRVFLSAMAAPAARSGRAFLLFTAEDAGTRDRVVGRIARIGARVSRTSSLIFVVALLVRLAYFGCAGQFHPEGGGNRSELRSAWRRRGCLATCTPAIRDRRRIARRSTRRFWQASTVWRA